MLLYALIYWGPVVVALVLAIVLRFSVLRQAHRMPAARVALTIAAGALPALAIIAPRLSSFFFAPMSADLMARAAIPLALGIVSILFLATPVLVRRTPSTAQLAPRTVGRFLSPKWPISLIVLSAAVVALSAAAGLASRRDDLGRFTEYGISIGTSGPEARTSIYGWHFSMPSLVLLTALLAVSACAWMLIPRPSWRDDLDGDAAERRLRAANVGRSACAAVLMHLSVVFVSLRSTAELLSTTETGELGLVTAGTPFAAISPVLLWSSMLAFAAGLALWVLVALSAVPLQMHRAERVAA